jgi:hypothetical protein
MAGPDYVLDKGFTAASVLTQFTFVKMSADEAVTAVTGATDRVLGVTQQPVVTADINKQAVDVRILGVTKAKVGTAGVTRGFTVDTDASGQVVNGGASPGRAVGIALQTGVTGDLVDVLLTPAGRVAA